VNQFVSTLNSTINNPTVSPDRKETAMTQLREIASNLSDPRSKDAISLLKDLGLTGDGQACPDNKPAGDYPDNGQPPLPEVATELPPDALDRAKEIINNPNSLDADKKKAWAMINDPLAYLRDVAALEGELLEELELPNLQAVPGGDIHHFLSNREKGWEQPGKGLFDKWLGLYWDTEEGSRKLEQLETYKLMHDCDRRGEARDLNSIALLTLVRRRIRTDPEFRKMLASGVKNEADLALIKLLNLDICKETEPEAVTV